MTTRSLQRSWGWPLMALLVASMWPAGGLAQNGEECLQPDTDNDGVPDVVERFMGTDPDAEDSDLDGVSDRVELTGRARTDPNDPDTDDDGRCDGPVSVSGVCNAGEDLNANGTQDPGETSSACPDLPSEEREQDAEHGVAGSSVLGCSSTGSAWSGFAGLGLALWFQARRRCRSQGRAVAPERP